MSKALTELMLLAEELGKTIDLNQEQETARDLSLTVPDAISHFNRKQYEGYTAYVYSPAPVCYRFRGCVKITGSDHMFIHLVVGSGQHDDSLPWPVRISYKVFLVDKDHSKEWEIGSIISDYDKPIRGTDNYLGWHTAVVLTRQELEHSILVANSSISIRWHAIIESKTVQAPTGDINSISKTCNKIVTLTKDLQAAYSENQQTAVKQVASNGPFEEQSNADADVNRMLLQEIRALRDESRDLKQQLQNQMNQQQEEGEFQQSAESPASPALVPIEDRHFSNITFEWKLRGLQSLKKNGGDIFSEFFYTGTKGYKLQVIARFKDGEMTTINLFVCQSPSDGSLQWPVNFRWSVSVYDHDGYFQRERKIAERLGQCTQRPEFGRVRQVGLGAGTIDKSYTPPIREDSVKNDTVLMKLVAKIC